jgi:hypothetical protein
LASLSLAALLASPANACCRNYAEFAAACRAQGGVPGFGASCQPQGGGAGAQSTPNQQLMQGLAGALGAGFADLLRNQEAQRAQARVQDMQQAAEQVIRFQEEERIRLEKHRKLLGSLKGYVDNTELAIKEEAPQTLELRAGAAAFGTPAAPGGSLRIGEERAGLSLKLTEEPKAPEGKPVDAATMDQVWQNYYRTADTYAEADVRRQQLEYDKKVAEQIRREAEKKYQEQQARAALIPVEQPARKAEDDKLGEAERLFRQAMELDEKATMDLEQAKRDAGKAKADMDQAESDRRKMENSLAQGEPG